MFQILVTTRYFTGSYDGGVSIHTLALSFATQQQADEAVMAINTQTDLRYKQIALKLY